MQLFYPINDVPRDLVLPNGPTPPYWIPGKDGRAVRGGQHAIFPLGAQAGGVLTEPRANKRRRHDAI